MYLVESLSRDKRSGRYTMYLPLSPQVICRAKRADTFAIPVAWYKCQNSQNVQKCLRRVPKVFSGLRAERPKRVSRTVQTLFRTGGNSLKQGFALCNRLFWGSQPGGPKTLLALSLGTFGHFGCFDTCTRPAESQRYIVYLPDPLSRERDFTRYMGNP